MASTYNNAAGATAGANNILTKKLTPAQIAAQQEANKQKTLDAARAAQAAQRTPGTTPVGPQSTPAPAPVPTSASPASTGGGPGDPMDPYATDAYGDIAAYENFNFDYPMELMKAKRMGTQSYDPQRQAALQNVYGGVESGNLGAMSQIAGTSGLSAADRQAINAQGQRQKVTMAQGSQAGINQMQAQNMYDTGNFNAGQSQQAEDFNAKALNQKARDVSMLKEQQAMNIYNRRLNEAILQRALEKSAEVAAGQK